MTYQATLDAGEEGHGAGNLLVTGGSSPNVRNGNHLPLTGRTTNMFPKGFYIKQAGLTPRLQSPAET